MFFEYRYKETILFREYQPPAVEMPPEKTKIYFIRRWRYLLRQFQCTETADAVYITFWWL